MSGSGEGIARSVHTRLVRHAKQIDVDPNHVLVRYAAERFLYRLSRSAHAERFVLKGALLLLAWLGETLRPTRDADLSGYGDLSDRSIASIFRDVCVVPVESDAMVYDPETVRIEPIRFEDPYGGKRVTLSGGLGAVRLRVRVDVGIGDAITPEPQWLDYPSLLEFPGARLRAYVPESFVAEKLHAMVVLGARNSRMRGFFDVYSLATRRSFDGDRLVDAIAATFERRKTSIPESSPIALTRGFAAIDGKHRYDDDCRLGQMWRLASRGRSVSRLSC